LVFNTESLEIINKVEAGITCIPGVKVDEDFKDEMDAACAKCKIHVYTHSFATSRALHNFNVQCTFVYIAKEEEMSGEI